MSAKVDAKSDRTLAKVGGIAAILSALFYLGTVFAGSMSPARPDDPSGYAGYLQEVYDSPLGDVLYGWLGLLAGIFAIFAIFGFVKVLRGVGERIWLPITALLVGGILLVFPYLPTLLIAYGLSAEFAGETFDTSALEMILAMTTTAQEVFWSVGSILTLTFGVGLFGYFSFQVPGVPKWMAWLGVVSGVLSLGWIHFFIPDPVDNVLFIVANLGLAAFAVYFIAMGAVMIRWRE